MQLLVSLQAIPLGLNFVSEVVYNTCFIFEIIETIESHIHLLNLFDIIKHKTAYAEPYEVHEFVSMRLRQL